MNHEPSGESTGTEERLSAALAPSLEALAAGGGPSRSGLLARYPALAGELEAFFANQDHAARWASPVCTLSSAARSDGGPADAAGMPTLPEGRLPAGTSAWDGGRIF